MYSFFRDFFITTCSDFKKSIERFFISFDIGSENYVLGAAGSGKTQLVGAIKRFYEVNFKQGPFIYIKGMDSYTLDNSTESKRIIFMRELHDPAILERPSAERCNVLKIPSLTSRTSDILFYFNLFTPVVRILKSQKVSNYNLLNRGNSLHFDLISNSIQKTLCEFSWPGEVRQLKNFTEFFYSLPNLPTDIRSFEYRFHTAFEVFMENEDLGIDLTFLDCQKLSKTDGFNSLKKTLATFEAMLIKCALLKNKGSLTRTARRLQIPITTLSSKISMRNYEIRQIAKLLGEE